MNEFKIEGSIETKMSHDEFSKKLLVWLVKNECEFFGMTIKQVEDDKSEV